MENLIPTASPVMGVRRMKMNPGIVMRSEKA
jgi:hypothetical protein